MSNEFEMIKTKMNEYESLENTRIITEILKNNGLEIYQDGNKFRSVLSKYKTLTFGDDIFQLINFNTTNEVYDFIQKNQELILDDFTWGGLYPAFQERISGMISEAMRNIRVTQWLFILTNVFRTEYLIIKNCNIATELPIVEVQKEFDDVDCSYEDFDYLNENYKDDTDSSLDITETEQELTETESQQMSLVTELSEIKDKLDENEDQIEEIGDKKISVSNKNKIQRLKAQNVKLAEEIKELQDAYDKAKADFDAYDREYQSHIDKAEEYKKLIKT